MFIKVCGIKHVSNFKEILCLTQKIELTPDFLGFISFKKSPRYVSVNDFQVLVSFLPANVQPVIVSVDSRIEDLKPYFEVFPLSFIQLHGDEDRGYINLLKQHFPRIKIIKAFLIETADDFNSCADFTECCDYYLFDTRGPSRGGNGIRFNWELLESYSALKPYFLSGGIRHEDLNEIKELAKKDSRLIGIDVNSGFEIKPGLKDIEKIKQLLETKLD